MSDSTSKIRPFLPTCLSTIFSTVVCCSALQCVAMCCSVLQCVAAHRLWECLTARQRQGLSHRPAPRRRWMLCVAVCCCVLQRVSVCCSASETKFFSPTRPSTTFSIALCCRVLECAAAHQRRGFSCRLATFLNSLALLATLLADPPLDDFQYCSVLQCVAVCCNMLQHVPDKAFLADSPLDEI